MLSESIFPLQNCYKESSNTNLISDSVAVFKAFYILDLRQKKYWLHNDKQLLI